MMLPAEVEAARRAILTDDFANVREALKSLQSEVTRQLTENSADAAQVLELESGLRDFFDWARSALIVSRSHLEHRIANLTAAGAYNRPATREKSSIQLRG